MQDFNLTKVLEQDLQIGVGSSAALLASNRNHDSSNFIGRYAKSTQTNYPSLSRADPVRIPPCPPILKIKEKETRFEGCSSTFVSFKRTSVRHFRNANPISNLNIFISCKKIHRSHNLTNLQNTINLPVYHNDKNSIIAIFILAVTSRAPHALDPLSCFQ